MDRSINRSRWSSLAEQLASRLNDVVPDGFSLRAVSSSVRVTFSSDSHFAETDLALLLGESASGLDICNAAERVMDLVQDYITRSSTRLWPQTDRNTLALPQCNLRNDELRLEFADEGDVVLELEPIDILPLLE